MQLVDCPFSSPTTLKADGPERHAIAVLVIHSILMQGLVEASWRCRSQVAYVTDDTAIWSESFFAPTPVIGFAGGGFEDQ